MNEPGYLLAVNLSLLLLFALYRVGLERETFFRVNRSFLLASLLLSFVLPLVTIPGVSGVLGLFPPESRALFDSGPAAGEGGGENRLESILLWAYAAGALFTAFRLTRRLVAIARFGDGRERAKTQEGYTIVRTPAGTPTFSYFRRLFWDGGEGLTAAQREMVLRHEIAHIRQRHSFDILLVELVGVLCWMNPVVGLYRRHLQEVHEFLADEAAGAEDGVAYQRLLAAQSLKEAGFDLAHSFTQTHVPRRIDRLRQARSGRSAAAKYSLALPAVLLLAMLCSPAAEENMPREVKAAPVVASLPQVAPEPVAVVAASEPSGTDISDVRDGIVDMSTGAAGEVRIEKGGAAVERSRSGAASRAGRRKGSRRQPATRRLTNYTAIEEAVLLAAMDSSMKKVAELDPERIGAASASYLLRLHQAPPTQRRF